MDALILSCGMGGGHNCAGSALREELMRCGHHAEMLNPYTLCSNRLAKRIDNTYISLVQKAPSMFGMVYAAGECYRRLPFRSPVYYANRKMAVIMQEYFQRKHFDIVLMPHIFPAEILTYMKHHDMEVPKTILIATDYTCIPFTEESDCDAYVVPDEELVAAFAAKGIAEDKIYALGIPTRQSFHIPLSMKEAKKALGLKIERKYVLISGGDIGAGKLEKILDVLYENITPDEGISFIVICGSNRRLYEGLQSKYDERVKIVAHTDEMATYLCASDLFITKPGGLSSTEAAVMGIPLLHISPIPGCETYNARFFAEHEMSRLIKPDEKSVDIVRECIYNRLVREQMICRQREKIHADAASQICRLASQIIA